MSESTASDQDGPGADRPHGELPEVEAPMDAAGVLAALERLAKRGKLAGFRRIDGRSFAVAAFGTPFDRELIGEIEDRAGGGAGASESGSTVARGTPHPGPLPGGEREADPLRRAERATSPTGDGEGGQVGDLSHRSTIRWRLVWKKRMPAIFAVVLVASVWPGLPVTDSMLSTYWGWYEGVTGEGGWLRTWMWYLPLTAPFVPLAWVGAVRKSRAGAEEHARETVEKVRGALSGEQ